MQFSDWASFWEMGGYGLYVWLSYGAFILSLVAAGCILRWQHCSLLKSVDKEQARKARIKASTQGKAL